jgi:hypothetical protein
MSCMAHRQVFRSFYQVSLRAKVVADQFCSECPAELSRVLADGDLLDHNTLGAGKLCLGRQGGLFELLEQSQYP